MSKPEKDAGTVILDLDGEKATLTPSLAVCMALTTDPRGLFGEGSIYERIQKLDLKVMAWIIRLGTNTGASGARGLEEQMYRAGLANLREPLGEFCGLVVTGGRRMDDEDGKKAEDPQTADV